MRCPILIRKIVREEEKCIARPYPIRPIIYSFKEKLN
jgi:hypothetical protein